MAETKVLDTETPFANCLGLGKPDDTTNLAFGHRTRLVIAPFVLAARLPLLPSVLALVLANCVPLIGTAFFGWDTFDVFAVYWTENLVVGAFMLGRIASHPAARWPATFGILLFFAAHYGLFCFVHGVLLVAAFGRANAPDDFFAAPAHLVVTAGSSAWGLGLIALIGSHGFSFVTNWWRRERHDRPLQLFAPYRRVVVMHVVLIAGAVLMWLMEGPSLVLALLVVAKVAADVMAHRAEHRAPDEPGPGPGPTITPPPRDSATGGGSDGGDYIAIE